MDQRKDIAERLDDYEDEFVESYLRQEVVDVAVAVFGPDACGCGCVTKLDFARARFEYNSLMDLDYGYEWRWMTSFVPFSEEHGHELDSDVALAIKADGCVSWPLGERL